MNDSGGRDFRILKYLQYFHILSIVVIFTTDYLQMLKNNH